MQYGYADNKVQITNRLKRIEGQVRGIARMVEEDKYCIDILTQVSAVEAAMDKVALELLRDHTKHCLTDPAVGPEGQGAKVEEIINAVDRLLKK